MEIELDPEIALLERFHGHLGPYAVLGYRMGKLANEELGEKGFDKTAFVYTGSKTPLSCIIDGIQLASGCTMGKGNIRVLDLEEPRARFHHKDGRAIEVRLKDEITEKVQSSFDNGTQHELCHWIWDAGVEELFEYQKSE